MRVEESSGRVEPLLASGTSRFTWMVSHLLLAVLGSALLMAASGLGVGVAHALQSGAASDLGRDLGAALVRLPAVWVLTGVGAALFGLAGRWTGFAWAVLVGCLVVGEFGQLMGLPEWTTGLSPYSHVPALPAQPLESTPLVALLVVAGALFACGFVAFRRRDVALG
jgi:ABC-2 type transport system permease protein